MKPAFIFLASILLCKSATGRTQEISQDPVAGFFQPAAEEEPGLKNPYSVGSKAPDISLESISEDTMVLSKVKSSLLLLSFWKTECGPCQDEYKSTLIPLYQKYFHQGFQIFAVSFDTNRKKWRRAIVRNEYTWIQVADFNGIKRSKTAQQYKIVSLPANYLLDENGIVLAKNLQGNQLKSFVEQYLEEK